MNFVSRLDVKTIFSDVRLLESILENVIYKFFLSWHLSVAITLNSSDKRMR